MPITDDILQIPSRERHDVKYFAMLNNAVAVVDTPYEGGQGAEAIAYYHYLLKIELPHCPLGLNLNSQQFSALKKGMSNFREMQVELDKVCKDKTLDTEQRLNKIREKIYSHTSLRSVCYLPTGWVGRPGHFAILKLRLLKNGYFAVSIINHGAGINQYHRPVAKSGSKEKYIYQSDEYEIDLESSHGRTFLQNLFELSYHVPTQNIINEYSADDLYGLLQLGNNKIPLTDKLSEKAITPQRGGTCTVTNTHAAARDILIDNDADLKTRKRYHFVIKLRSIIAGFSEYKDNYYPLDIMEWALREFAVRLNKEYRNVLTDEEIIYCSELQKYIQDRLDTDKKITVEKKCAAVPLPKVEGSAPKINKDVLPVDDKGVAKVNEVVPPPTVAKISATIKPNEIIQYFVVVEDATNPLTIKHFYDLFNKVPHCSGLEKDPFWDLVPADHIWYVIQALYKITARLNASHQNFPEMRAQCFAVALMAYDIAAQLAPRCIESKRLLFPLDNRYAFGLDDVYSELTFYTDPVVYHTIKRIVKNFALRTAGKERIFTNAVGLQEVQFDNTVHFIMKGVLTSEQRETVAQSLMTKRREKQAKYTDFELFRHLLSEIEMKQGGRFIVDPAIRYLIGLSGTAHALGNFIASYHKNEGSEILLFSNNQFHQELQRTNSFKKLKISKLFPKNDSGNPTDHQDCSENTIYHPRGHLQGLRNELIAKASGQVIYSPQLMQQPYQLCLSGSLRLKSTIWDPIQKIELMCERWNEEFRHIECSPNLQIVRVLSWAKVNSAQLIYVEVQNRINELLFQYGKLDHAFHFHLEPTLQNMQGFFSAVLQSCQDEAPHDSQLLYWAALLTQRLCYYLEVAAALNPNISLNQVEFPSFQPLLLERIIASPNCDNRSMFASVVVCGFQTVCSLTIEDCLLVLICRVIANLGDSSSICDDVWNKIQGKVLSILSKEGDNLTNRLNGLANKYLKLKAVAKWELRNAQLVATDSDFIIDINSGSLKKNTDTLIDRTEKTIAENQELFALLHLTPNNITLLYSQQSSTLISSDGVWLFSGSIDWNHSFTIDQTKQWITIEGKQEQFVHVKENYKLLANPFESSEMYGKNYIYWQLCRKSSVYFVNQRNSHVGYLYDYYKDVIFQFLADVRQQWQRTGKLLMTRSGHRDQQGIVLLADQWRTRLNPILGSENVRYIAGLNHDQTQCRLERIESLALRLNFTVNSQQQLVCDAVPDYFLSDQQGLPILQGLPNVMIMQNQDGERKYIIPAFSLKKGSENNAFNSDIIDTNKLCNKSQPYYFLTFNRTHELQGDQLEANLYLAIVYRSLGDFKRAFQCLEFCKSPKQYY